MQSKKIELTKVLARFIAETGASDIPPIVYEHAKVAFLDWFAVAMAGKDEPLVLKLIRFSDLMGGTEQASILGHGIRRNVSLATLINGSASHALDYDDTMGVYLPVHPSSTLFPSLLALSEWRGKAGIDFLAAYLIGFKVAACIQACAGSEHYLAGWHATSTIGRLASAASCAKLMGLDEQQTVYALGIAGTQASGLRRVFGTMCKPFHAGKASQDGLEAVLLAMEGFTSAEDILEGPAGFFQLFKGRIKEEAVDSLGKTWDVEHLAQKYHASAH
jgi:2-methylcitrate dehydratase PrpD